MLKTAIDIERDFFEFVSESDIASVIRGNIYREGDRARDAQSEDIVVAFLSGIDAQVQTGIVIINIYVPLIQGRGGGATQDRMRIGELMPLLRDFTQNGGSVEYALSTVVSPTYTILEEANQSVIYTQIHFKRLS